MEVFLAEKYGYEESYIIGIFSSIEKAVAAVEIVAKIDNCFDEDSKWGEPLGVGGSTGVTELSEMVSKMFGGKCVGDRKGYKELLKFTSKRPMFIDQSDIPKERMRTMPYWARVSVYQVDLFDEEAFKDEM